MITITASQTETITCPNCDHVQTAEATLLEGAPFWSRVQECEACHYLIMESEWELASDEQIEIATLKHQVQLLTAANATKELMMKDTVTMTVTHEECEMILNLRKANEAQKNHIHILDVAHKFAKWLDQEQAGATYSTFCDDFGYTAKEGEDRPSLYDSVIEIIRTARHC